MSLFDLMLVKLMEREPKRSIKSLEKVVKVVRSTYPKLPWDDPADDLPDNLLNAIFEIVKWNLVNMAAMNVI